MENVSLLVHLRAGTIKTSFWENYGSKLIKMHFKSTRLVGGILYDPFNAKFTL